jgi:hypothetical protein
VCVCVCVCVCVYVCVDLLVGDGQMLHDQQSQLDHLVGGYPQGHFVGVIFCTEVALQL